MPNIIPTYDPLTAPKAIVWNVDQFEWDSQGIPSTGTPGAPFSDPIPVPFRLPTLPVIGQNQAPAVKVQGSSGDQFTRTVDPGYSYWGVRAPFMGQGFYDQVPDTFHRPVTGNGTPNVHAQALRAGVQTQLAQYSVDPYTASIAYVGALTPQTIPVGYGGIQA